MKPGCTVNPQRVGYNLYKPYLPFGVLKYLKDDIRDLIDAGVEHLEFSSDVIQFIPPFRKKFRKQMVHFENLEKDGEPITNSIHIDHVGFCFPARHGGMGIATAAQFQMLVEYYKRLNPIHYTLHLGPSEIFTEPALKNVSIHRDPIRMIKNLATGRLASIFKKVSFKSLAIEEALRVAPRAFERLAEMGPDLKKIYIENADGMTRDEFDALFNPLSKKVPELGCLLDVGHLLKEEYLKNKNCLEDFIEYWGGKKKKLKAVHCHDVVFVEQNYTFDKKILAELIDDLERAFKEKREKLVPILDKLKKFVMSGKPEMLASHFIDHQNLGTGILDLSSLLRALKKVDFKGPVIFEPGTYEGMLDSVKLLAQEIEKVKNTNKSKNP